MAPARISKAPNPVRARKAKKRLLEKKILDAWQDEESHDEESQDEESSQDSDGRESEPMDTDGDESIVGESDTDKGHGQFSTGPDDLPGTEYNLDGKSRALTYLLLCSSFGKWATISNMLNQVPRRKLAYALNDLPEWARIKALAQLKARHYMTYYKCVGLITYFQANRGHLDPKRIFPCVATDEFMKILSEDARFCQICGEGFEEGRDIHWKYCMKHTLHYGCLKAYLSRDQAVLTGCTKCFNDDEAYRCHDD